LNEAKGYRYLKSIGCNNIRFVPRARVTNLQTPDLEAELDQTKILCEVKTINVSENEAERRQLGGVGTTSRSLDREFLKKLQSTIESASAQLNAYTAGGRVRRMILVVFNFDDALHEYGDDYRDQIEGHLADIPDLGAEVILDIKSPFHAAT
jgi:hypothetical protein